MTELELKIKKAAQVYYTDGSSDISDAEFDALVEQLRKEQPDSVLLKTTGWGYNVNKDSTPGEKCLHKYGEAGSLSKAYNWNEINKEFKGKCVDISAKLDGLSVVLYYQKGKLVQALTRGDGHTGIDITDKAKYIICDSIRDTYFTGAVRGEIIMSKDNFQKFKMIHPEAKNARNSTAGLVNSKNYTAAELDFLEIIPYSVVGVEFDANSREHYGATFKDIAFTRNWLEDNFDTTVDSAVVSLQEYTFFNDLSNYFNTWSEKYNIDGIVITSEYNTINHHSIIQNSQAFKFKAETAQAKVVDVEWNMSKSGYAVPRVHIETVQLSGTNVSYCAGENARNVINNKIGIGAIVEVEKHGEIIPNINEVITPAAELNVPEVCPHCKSKLEWAGVHLACMNEDCGSASYHDVMIWTDVLAPVDNLGRKLKRQFFEEAYGYVPTIEQLMEKATTAYKGSIEGTQAYRMRAMLDKIHGESEIQLVDAIKALNIPRFGDVTAAKLAQYPNHVKELLNLSLFRGHIDEANQTKLFNELSKLIGDANTVALRDNMVKVKRLTFLEHRIIWEPPAVIAVTERKGKVAITGKLSVKRSVFEQELRDAGYIPGSIVKDTTFLITDDPTSSSSKNKKADEWGITKITESEFRQKYMN